MSLNKTEVPINFSKGLDLKSDPHQVQVGNFLALQNSVFTTTGRLTKRNGFNNITTLPNDNQTTLTTLNDNLIATGSNLYAFSQDTNQSIVRASTGQSAPDIALAPNGLLLTVYIDSTLPYYQISDSVTGQQIVARTALPATAFSPRVVVMGVYFIITYIVLTGGTNRLHYIAIPISQPSVPGPDTTISTDVAPTSPGYDTTVINDKMYFAWAANSNIIKTQYLTSALALSTVANQAFTADATLVSISADGPSNVVYVTYFATTPGGKTIAYDLTLTPIMAPSISNGGNPIRTAVSIANGRSIIIYYANPRSFGSFDPPHIIVDFVFQVILTLPVSGVGTGTISGVTTVKRNASIASKPFVKDGLYYILLTYGNTNQADPQYNSNQPTYFLVDQNGNTYLKIAYSNGGGYPTTQVVPSVYLQNGNYYLPYLISDFLTTVNKGTNLPTGTPVNAIYTQLGINLAIFSLNTVGQQSSEIADALHLTGGQLWEYDGVRPVELGFHLYPETIVSRPSATGGLLTAQTYFYSFTYEWTDNQGNLHRSAPSIPVKITTTGATSSVEFDVNTLLFTYKAPPNPVRIVGYRWSTAQQIYYQFTSITSPPLNVLNQSSIVISDTLADSAILGNPILYTTGGVVENIGAPACIASCLFNNRLFIISAENRNLLWFSKVVIQNVPVEMSDLLTKYVAPTTGAQGSTGPMTALGAMDDKLIIFKKDAIYYINGTGPDNTGANDGFSDPIFITGTVGCANPNSVVLIPDGIMFQSDKGIWLLARDLSTRYIGAPVEQFNNEIIESAEAIPGTNQVRFIISNTTLMYDYFFAQWGTHTNVRGISGTLYQGAHTYLNDLGQVYQEQSGLYSDGAKPVLMSLTTSWINIAGLQGYERFYFMHLLGTYFTPFKLNVQMAYNYNPSPTQATLVTPDNFVGPWGSEANWGSGGPWGGPGNIFEARVFPTTQKCESFQLTITEVYDASLGVMAGQGLTLSGLELTVGIKKGYRVQSAGRSFGR